MIEEGEEYGRRLPPTLGKLEPHLHVFKSPEAELERKRTQFSAAVQKPLPVVTGGPLGRSELAGTPS